MSQRSLDWARRLEEDPPSSAEYPDLIVEALAAADWYSAYMWSKTWVAHGAATAPDPWLGYAASALVHRQPKNAVNALDTSLEAWIEALADRAIVRHCRGMVIWHRLNDPRIALPDFEAAEDHAPAWLAPLTQEALAACASDAASSRTRVPSVEPAPSYSARLRARRSGLGRARSSRSQP